jgi:hypothetical protein
MTVHDPMKYVKVPPKEGACRYCRCAAALWAAIVGQTPSILLILWPFDGIRIDAIIGVEEELALWACQDRRWV